MDQPSGMLYISNVVPVQHGTWRQLRLPAATQTPSGTLTTTGQAFGLQVAPDETIPSVAGKLSVAGWWPATVDVDIELGAWSHDHRELGIRPQRRLPFWVSEARYRRAAAAVLDDLTSSINALGAARTARELQLTA
jgi:hypothetical protein